MNRQERRARLKAEYAAEYAWWREHVRGCPRCYTALAAGVTSMACAGNEARLIEFVRHTAYWRSVQRAATAGASA